MKTTVGILLVTCQQMLLLLCFFWQYKQRFCSSVGFFAYPLLSVLFCSSDNKKWATVKNLRFYFAHPNWLSSYSQNLSQLALFFVLFVAIKLIVDPCVVQNLVFCLSSDRTVLAIKQLLCAPLTLCFFNNVVSTDCFDDKIASVDRCPILCWLLFVIIGVVTTTH